MAHSLFFGSTECRPRKSVAHTHFIQPQFIVIPARCDLMTREGDEEDQGEHEKSNANNTYYNHQGAIRASDRRHSVSSSSSSFSSIAQHLRPPRRRFYSLGFPTLCPLCQLCVGEPCVVLVNVISGQSVISAGAEGRF